MAKPPYLGQAPLLSVDPLTQETVQLKEVWPALAKGLESADDVGHLVLAPPLQTDFLEEQKGDLHLSTPESAWQLGQEYVPDDTSAKVNNRQEARALTRPCGLSSARNLFGDAVLK